MPYFRLKYNIPGNVKIRVSSEDLDLLEDIPSLLEDSSRDTEWLRRILIEGLCWEECEMDDVQIEDRDLSPEEELNFGD